MTSSFRRSIARRMVAACAFVFSLAALAAPAVRADDGPTPPPPPPPMSPAPVIGAQPTGPAPADAGAAAQPDAPRFTRDQLVELVGPVALYPDAVLSSLLPATTFPLDVVAAARWIRENRDQTPTQDVLQGWDPSVQSLVQ